MKNDLAGFAVKIQRDCFRVERSRIEVAARAVQKRIVDAEQNLQRASERRLGMGGHVFTARNGCVIDGRSFAGHGELQPLADWQIFPNKISAAIGVDEKESTVLWLANRRVRRRNAVRIKHAPVNAGGRFQLNDNKIAIAGNDIKRGAAKT